MILFQLKNIAADISSSNVLSPYKAIRESDNVPSVCTWTSPPTCLATPIETLMWNLHGKHDYQLYLRVNGVNGLSRLVTSSVYTHYSGAPAAGVVIELAIGDVHISKVSILCKMHTFCGFVACMAHHISMFSNVFTC